MTDLDSTIIGGWGTSTQNAQVNQLVEGTDEPTTGVTTAPYTLSTSAQTIVGAINEINSKPSVGEISFMDEVNGNGEIFNNYDGDKKNIANAFASHAEGYKNSCYGPADHVEGSQNKSQSTKGVNHIEGVLNTIHTGGANHVEGYNNSLTNCTYSHCESYFYNLYNASSTHIEGGAFTIIYLNADANSNIAYLSKEIGLLSRIKTNEELLEYFNHPNLSILDPDSMMFYDIQSVTIGDYNGISTIKFTLNATLSETVLINAKYDIQRQIIYGNYNHIEGASNYCESNSTHIEGSNHTALSGSTDVHIEGGANFVEGNLDCPHIEGYCNRVSNSYEHAEGCYNVSNSLFISTLAPDMPSDTGSVTTIHSVGIGSSPNDRKNAHEIMFNGDHYIYGLGGYDGTNATDSGSTTLQRVVNGKAENFTAGTGLEMTEDRVLNVTTDLTPYLKSTDAAATYLSKTDAVGKIDSTSDGTGEVFNSYEGIDANVASGDYSHAEGSKTTASGANSHAEGWYTNAAGNYSHAEGSNTIASVDTSHAEGSWTKATGGSSHAEGSHTNAAGNYSHAEGFSTMALNPYEHAEGHWNISYNSEDESIRVIHSVGIGSTIDDRKNAHEIKFNGDHYVYGVGGFDGTNSDTAQTLQEVINNKADSTLLPTYTTVPTLTAAYTIPANATMVEKIYMITIGATVYDVTGDASIKWAGGVTPTASANSILVVSVLNNLATWQTFI